MIRVQNVTKMYDGGVVALKDTSLEVDKGDFVFLVGASGSGKSTMLRLMMREEKPTNGDIWVAGKHASKLPNWKIPMLRRSIGTVFQDFKLLPNKTVYENVAFALEATGKPRHVINTQVPQVLKLVGLSAKSDRYPKQLSGGEQQRVSVARAFVNRPLILLADEPTGNLDPATSVGIMRILDRINRTGTTVVMATHDHAIVDAMRRRVVQLERGRIVRDQDAGGYQTLRRRKASPDTTGETPIVSPSDDETPIVSPSDDETGASPLSGDTGAAGADAGETPDVPSEEAAPDPPTVTSTGDVPEFDDSVESDETSESDSSAESTDSDATDPSTDVEEETV
jgi:cell division transport system ATP-binding protein